MHEILTTEGVVLKKRAIGEANVVLSLLTSDLGLIRAIARSGRAERSKLRYGIEPFMQGRFSFVKGRHEWRLVGVEASKSHFLNATPRHQTAVGRITTLVLRLVQGQEPTPALYKVIEKGFFAVARGTQEDIANIECVLVLRILDCLGYVPYLPEIAPFTENEKFSHEILSSADRSRPFLVRTINESLKASQL